MGTLRASGRSIARVSGQMVPRLHRELPEGCAMTRTDPATPAGIGTGVADREPPDGVCSRETRLAVFQHSVRELARLSVSMFARLWRMVQWGENRADRARRADCALADYPHLLPAIASTTATGAMWSR